MKKVIKKISWLFAITLVFSMFFNFMTKISAAVVSPTNYTVTTTFSNNSAPVQPNGSYGESKFIISPTFKISNSVDLRNGDVINYTLPDVLKYDTSRTFELKSDIGTGEVHFATLKVTDDSKTAVVEIVNEDFFRTLGNNRTIKVDLTAVWDKNVMPLNTPRNFDLNGYGNITLTRILIDEEPRGISKWGVQRSDDPSIIEWRIRVNRDLNQMTNVKLVDTIRPGQELVGQVRGHYFKDFYNGPNQAFTTADTNIVVVDNRNFEITLKDLDHEGAFIYYQTRLVDWRTVEAATTNIYNDVVLTKAGADPVVPVTGQAKITTIGGGGTATPDKIIIPVKAQWDDANNQDGKRQNVVISLFANGQDTGKTITLTEANNWEASFTDLNKEDNGQVVNYTVVASDVAHYTKAAVTGTSATGFVVPYHHQPEVVDYEVEKIWADSNNQDGKRPAAITVKLYQSVDNAPATEVVGKTIQLTDANVDAADANKWVKSFTNLPKYQAGKLISYSVQEDTASLPTGYTSTVAGQTITNTYTPEVINYEVKKVWADSNNQDGKRPAAITVKLYQSVDNAPATEVVGKTIELTDANALDANTWVASFTNLPKYQAGKLISYSVQEDTASLPTGYTPTVVGQTITNTYTPEVINYEVKKVWADSNNQDGKRPTTITVKLYQSVDNAPATEVVGKTIELTDANALDANTWVASFTNLPKYQAGKLISYSVQEDTASLPAGYTPTVVGKTITNTYTPETVNITVNKIWNDEDNRHGKRPTTITVNLSKTVAGQKTPVATKVVQGPNWETSFEQLPKYEAGQEIVYTVDEEPVDSYKKEINGFTITNTFTEEKEDFTVVVVIDGVASTSEYKDITYSQLLDIVAAINETHKDLVAGEVNYNGNTVTLNFTTPAPATEDYTIVVVVDGVVSSTTEYKGITHAQFLEALAATMEANKTLVAGEVNYDGNKVTLNFTTPPVPTEDYKIVVIVDGVASNYEYKGITHAQFLEALAAVTEANNGLVAGAVEWNGNTVTLNFTTPAPATEDYTIVVVVDGVVSSTTEYKGITHAQFLEALAAVTEANSALVAGEVNYEGNKVTLNFTTPVVPEEKADYTIVVVVDGVVSSTTEYKGITHAQFLEALAAITEANSALVAGEVSYEGNKVTLNFTTKAVEEAKEDYTIVVVVDGVASTYEYKGITHAQFLEALVALTEANSALEAGAVHYDGNKVTLNFKTPAERKDEWVGDDFVGSKDTDAKTIVSVDTVVEDKGQKLPETGSAGLVAQMVLGASALLGSLGLALKKKR